MAKYTSQYPFLMFYVNGELCRFNNGVFTTDEKDAMAVLDTLIDVKKDVEEKVEQKTEAKPATKAPARKASTK